MASSSSLAFSPSDAAALTAGHPRVSLLRIYALRATYLLIAVGLGVEIWPDVLHHAKPWHLMEGVVNCILAAVSLLALLGLRQPLTMLPLLLFELVWKSLWLAIVALPAWQAHAMDGGTRATALACAMGVIFPVVIPWRYVWAQYVTRRGERWS